MSTHALIIISNDDADTLRLTNSYDYASIYIHFDGYPQGVGTELAEHLAGYRITAGISGGVRTEKTANGMECLAAQVVGNLKEFVGNVYLTLNNDSFDDACVDYLYFISPAPETPDEYGGSRVNIRVEAKTLGEVLFDGPVDDFHRTITGPLGVAALWERI
tara:strand:- start:9834 stop:10316 length:483 start_codon:yes stop_codon:yes gene_type:complete